MPKATYPAKWDKKDIEIDTGVDFYNNKQPQETKQEAVKKLGFNQKQVELHSFLKSSYQVKPIWFL
jgi:hypothetical protein